MILFFFFNHLVVRNNNLGILKCCYKLNSLPFRKPWLQLSVNLNLSGEPLSTDLQHCPVCPAAAPFFVLQPLWGGGEGWKFPVGLVLLNLHLWDLLELWIYSNTLKINTLGKALCWHCRCHRVQRSPLKMAAITSVRYTRFRYIYIK